jgi:hypothetical protein
MVARRFMCRGAWQMHWWKCTAPFCDPGKRSSGSCHDRQSGHCEARDSNRVVPRAVAAARGVPRAWHTPAFIFPRSSPIARDRYRSNVKSQFSPSHRCFQACRQCGVDSQRVFRASNFCPRDQKMQLESRKVSAGME